MFMNKLGRKWHVKKFVHTFHKNLPVYMYVIFTDPCWNFFSSDGL